MRPELRAISLLLSQRTTPGSFAVRILLSRDFGSLRVKGIPLALPVSPEQAVWLCEQATPALHGYKDETRLDPRVRDTWEIPGSQVTVSDQDSPRLPLHVLEQIRAWLGIPRGCQLRAELHNLLIYQQGQFFAPHQDSEKRTGMIGTLVLCLPCQGEGGELVIEHQGKKKVFGIARKDITLMAFYADCRHEVLPVRSGHRVALTIQLIVEGEPVPPDVASNIDTLTAEIRRYFDTLLPPAGMSPFALRQPPKPRLPDRLVYLLDHQYTRSGLTWRRLKGTDAENAAALREVAARLDCEIDLALADVHEGWQGEDIRSEYNSEGRQAGESPEQRRMFACFMDSFSPHSELFRRGSRHIELRHWLEPSGQLPHSNVSEAELCYTLASSELPPCRTESVLYTGNEAAGIECWYHRAALIMGPRARLNRSEGLPGNER